ncbi:FliG C-terminal domain-containing protein [Stieleria varia]|uniref:Flagellar motor switch protein FliG n=1 Tax=Stieleria varia TaxID=2528005 RepID=A0A5C6AQ55_9BACT|nr:FliG C-terminal domain-containing protein [Stieleria varia]TWU02173.1 Flagellar motor switch protein FliG [Stieleria varia]
MTMLTRSERLALLVNLLGDEAAASAKAGLSGDALANLENAITDFQQYPPSQEEIDLVLDDFSSYFQMALQASGRSGLKGGDAEDDSLEDDDDAPAILQLSEDQFDVEVELNKRFDAPKLTGNLIVDLNHVHPYQLAHGLRNERPQVIAIVVRRLADEHAAKTIEFLPETLRPLIFLQLANQDSTSSRVTQCVLEKALELALDVKERRSEEDSAEKMARLMRSMPRSLQGPMLEELAKSDEELAEQVKGLLYRFDDLKKLEARDLQKLLGQCQTDVLVVALQNVEEDLLNHVLGNMSKRAKEALQEEMQYKANAKQDEIDSGRSEVVKILIELVESGAVEMA